MLHIMCLILYTAASVAGVVIPRDDGPPDPGSATVADPGLQSVPDTAKSPNTFSNGRDEVIGGFPYSPDPIPDLYQPRDIDIPFGRMFHGNISMFAQGQLNDPNFNTSQWTPNVYDFANQSACGIPDNAYLQGKAAIHPYFLKYAGLDRYCMQDVCLSLWPEGGPPDMIVKVVDICSTDPSDPTYCATPADIKIDRAKVQMLYGIPSPGPADPDLQGDKFPKGTYWHLTKCWTNALPQPAYHDNWFAQPPLPNNFNWDVDATRQQWQNNQKSYPSKGWSTYPDGLEIPTAESEAGILPITDWVLGQEPAWAPIAGGVGFGTPERSHGPPPGLWPGKSTANAAAGAGASGGGNSTTSSTLVPGNSANATISGSVIASQSNATTSQSSIPGGASGTDDNDSCDDE